MAGNSRPSDDGPRPHADAGIGDVARGVWRRKFWVLLPTAAVTLGALGWLQVATPTFKSEARVLVERTETPFTRPEAERNQSTDRQALDAEAIASQVQLMMSRDLARRIVTDLKLGEKPEFDPVLAGLSLPKRLLIMAGLVPNPLNQTAEDRVLDSFFQHLTAYPVDGSRVITVEFQSRDRGLAADVSNAVVDDYLTTLASSKQDATRDASRWLSGEIEDLRHKVADAEGKVEAFRSKANLFSGPNNTTLNAQRLAEYNTQITLARTEQTQAESRANAVRELLKNGGITEVSASVNSDLLRRLAEQRSALRAQRAEIVQTLLDRHPRVREITAQIGEIDAQFRAEALRLVRAAETDAALAAKRADEVAANLEKLKGETTVSSDQEVQLRALEREARASRDLLEAYLGKYRETLARESNGAAPPDARVISRATPSSEPFFPKALPIVLISFFGSLFVSTGIVAAGVLHGAAPAQVATTYAPAPLAREPEAPPAPSPITAAARPAPEPEPTGVPVPAVVLEPAVVPEPVAAPVKAAVPVSIPPAPVQPEPFVAVAALLPSPEAGPAPRKASASSLVARFRRVRTAPEPVAEARTTTEPTPEPRPAPVAAPVVLRADTAPATLAPARSKATVASLVSRFRRKPSDASDAPAPQLIADNEPVTVTSLMERFRRKPQEASALIAVEKPAMVTAAETAMAAEDIVEPVVLADVPAEPAILAADTPLEPTAPQDIAAPSTAAADPVLEPTPVAAADEMTYAAAITSLVDAIIARPGKRLAVAASNDETASTFALDLSRALAATGGRIVLVDGDASPSVIARMTGLETQTGLLDFLADKVRLSQILHRDSQSRAHIVPAGQASDLSIHVSEKRAALVSMLSAVYDRVIIELPAIVLGEPTTMAVIEQVLVINSGVEAAALADSLRTAGLARVDLVQLPTRPSSMGAGAESDAEANRSAA